MKADEYRLMSQCVENGARRAAHRLFKHRDSLTSEDDVTIIDEVENCVMLEICEWFRFDGRTEE